jgi:hypothetical protein
MRASKLMAGLRHERQQRELAMTVAERFALADRLREEGIQAYMTSHGMDRESAIRAIRKSRGVGRPRPSRCLDAARSR